MPKRGFLYAGIALYVASLMLSLPFPNNMNTYATLSVLSIPLQTSDGVYIKGIFSLLLLLGAISCFIQCMKAFKAVAVIVPLVLYIVLPSVMIPMYQAYFAHGMHALSYNAQKAACQLTQLEDEQVQLYCELPIKNYSDEAVTVGVEFIGKNFAEQALNKHAPYEVSIQAKQQRMVIIDTQWATDHNEHEAIHVSAPSIRFIEGDKKRTM